MSESKKLTKDDFEFDYDADKYYVGLVPRHFDSEKKSIEFRDQILKNQKMCTYYEKFSDEHDMLKVLEDAEKYRLYDWSGNVLLTNHLIVERLKKRIEQEKEFGKAKGISTSWLIELQKILGEEK